MTEETDLIVHEAGGIRKAKGSSDRSFGFVFTAAFLIAGLLPLRHGQPPRLWAFPVAVVFLSLALLAPSVLRPLNLAWAKLGFLLHRIMNPLIMGFLFFACLTPFALLFRFAGRDPLKRKFDPAADSYWVPRGAADGRGSMDNQF